MERNTSSHNSISKIDFGLLSMPTRIQFTNGSVTEYIYAADGTKLRTIHRTSVSGPAIPYGTRHTLTNQETLSLDSITYIDGLEIDKFFNCKYYFDNGYLTLGNTGSGEYHYTIKDHLGNIRTVVDASGSVEQVNSYYAYGGLLNDVPASVDVQTHKYNGKELDLMHGLNEYDYVARQQDPATGQFTSMDPLCEKYYHISPYAYCGGNPVNRVDIDGRDWYEYNGKRMWESSVEDTYKDKQGHEWKNIGHTFMDNKSGTYYSLFGQQYALNDENLKAIQLLDNAIIDYSKPHKKTINSYSTETINTIRYDFNKAYKFTKNSLISDNNTHNFYYGGDEKELTGKTAHVIYCNIYKQNIATDAQVFQYLNYDGRGCGNIRGHGIALFNPNNMILHAVYDKKDIRIYNRMVAFYNQLVSKYKNK